jgi:glycyl-tRNA synthetase
MDAIVSLCKRRGFIFQASEIYGGLNGFWDYGPLGVELKNNLRDRWWRDMVRTPPIGPDGEPVEIVGLDSAIIQHPQAWEASGHLAGFSDPMVDDRESKARYRADHLNVLVPKSGEGRMYAYYEEDQAPIAKLISKAKGSVEDYTACCYTEIDAADYPRVLAPGAKEAGTLTEPREFNLMFKTFIGATSGEDNVAYLRPETAQGIFLNFKNIVDNTRVKMPFGVAQIGKAFRNEVTPRNFIFRSREFEQMEMEFFCHPDDSEKWVKFWQEERLNWWKSLGVSEDRLLLREHEEDELSHYAAGGHGTVDVEYRYPFTDPEYGELEGIAHRRAFDLSQHQEHAKTKLEYFDQERNERYIPEVIEPAAGLTRGVLVLLCEAYCEEWVPKGDGGEVRPAESGQPVPEGFELRTVLKFNPSLAPVKVAIFPLLKNKPPLVAKAKEVYNLVRSRWATFWDVTGAIGRRYRRQDEIGTPYCVTIDFESLDDNCVTLRDRDTMKQERISIDELVAWLSQHLDG